MLQSETLKVCAVRLHTMAKKEELEELRLRVANADLPLKDHATNLVFGKGNPNAEILFVGEAPGKNEDLKGLPFVGAAGKQLDELLRGIGLTIDDVYIANILKYRPPNNRDPNEEEIRAHTPFLVEQIKIISPKVICTLGNFATKFALARFDCDGMKKIGGISKLHGNPRKIQVDGHEFTVIPLYHPAAMLYRRQLKEVLDEDFQKVKEHIGNVKLKKGLLDYST